MTPTTTAAPFDLTKVARGAQAVDDPAMPAPIRRPAKDNPLVPVVEEAARTGKRYVLKDRYSLTPFPGKKGACEAHTVMAQLHRAAKTAGVKLQVRRFDVKDHTCKITFKVLAKLAREA